MINLGWPLQVPQQMNYSRGQYFELTMSGYSCWRFVQIVKSYCCDREGGEKFLVRGMGLQ